jgi:outer membrane protein W
MIATVLMASTDVQAQFVQDFQLNLFVAGTTYTKNNYRIGFPQSVPAVPGSFKFGDAIRGGARANVYTHRHWGQEFYYSYEPNQATFTTGTGSELKVDTGIHNLGVNALYYFGDGLAGFSPFVSAGIGATIYKPTTEARQIAGDPTLGNFLTDLDTSTEFSFNYGLGFTAQMSSVFGFRVDARGFVGRNPTFGYPRSSDDPNEVIIPASGAIHNAEVSAGIVFFFQRRQ